MVKTLLLLTLLTLPLLLKSQCLEIDVVIVGDLSGSIGNKKTIVADAFQSFINRFELSERGIKIGALVFADHTTVLSNLTSDRIELNRRIRDLEYTDVGAMTDMYSALNVAKNELLNNGRFSVQKMIILVSDGIPTDETNLPSLIAEIKLTHNIIICGVYIDTSDNPFYNYIPPAFDNSKGSIVLPKINNFNPFYLPSPQYTLPTPKTPIPTIPNFLSIGGEEFMENISEPFCYVATDYNKLAKALDRLNICF